MENNLFKSSSEITADSQNKEQIKITKTDLQNSVSTMQEPYNELVEISVRVNKFSKFSIEDITSRIQNMTDKLASLPEDADEKVLSSLKTEVDDLVGSLGARIEAAKTRLSRFRL